MKQSFLGKWLSIVSLCFVLVALPVGLGACSLFENGPTYAANGSVQSPYSLTLSRGTCTAWRVVLAPDIPFCALSLPTQQVGMYIQVSYNGSSQLSSITSIDAKKHVVYLK